MKVFWDDGVGILRKMEFQNWLKRNLFTNYSSFFLLTVDLFIFVIFLLERVYKLEQILMNFVDCDKNTMKKNYFFDISVGKIENKVKNYDNLHTIRSLNLL